MIDVLARLRQIESLISGDQFGAARERLDRLAVEMPEFAYVPLLRATLALRQNQLSEAEDQAREAVRMAPEDDVPRRILGSVLIAGRRAPAALPILDEAIALDPTNSTNYAVQAQALVQLDRFAEAETSARAGLALDPDDESCRNFLTLALNLMGRREDATLHATDLLELNPQNPNSHTNAGFVALHRGRIDVARTHFVEALRLEPRHEGAQSGLAEVIKATNPFYRWLIAYGVWMRDIGSRYRWAIIIGLLVVIRVVPILVPFYLVLLLWNWFTSPLSTLYLAFHSTGRYLISTRDRPLALGIGACVVVALVLVALAIGLGDIQYAVGAAAFGLAMLPLQYLIDHEDSRRGRGVNVAFLIAYLGLGIAYVLTAALGVDFDAGALILVAVVYSWVGTRVG